MILVNNGSGTTRRANGTLQKLFDNGIIKLMINGNKGQINNNLSLININQDQVNNKVDLQEIKLLSHILKILVKKF